ncbi:hypothetical protein D3C76_859420 [compost metagenome]
MSLTLSSSQQTGRAGSQHPAIATAETLFRSPFAGKFRSEASHCCGSIAGTTEHVDLTVTEFKWRERVVEHWALGCSKQVLGQAIAVKPTPEQSGL